jgi:TPP-dependent pyruvate/acetoin dehydrogenase alpha subunit
MNFMASGMATLTEPLGHSAVPTPEALLALERPRAERYFQQMVLIRTLETALLDMFSRGLLGGTTHTSIGQEANAVGVVDALDRSLDTIWSNHRCHGHFIAYSGEIVGLLAEIMGRIDGVSGGRGGSQHLCFRNFRSNGIQGGIAPVAVGTAMAGRESGAITTVFLGDGTMGEGAVYESLNLAAILNAPLLFVIEDNGIAQTTPKQLTVAGSIRDRSLPFGVRAFDYDGFDPLAVNDVAQAATEYVRGQSRPAWLTIRTERLGPHSKGDDTRTEAEMERARARDPLPPFRTQIADPDSIETFCRMAVLAAIDACERAPMAGVTRA